MCLDDPTSSVHGGVPVSIDRVPGEMVVANRVSGASIFEFIVLDRVVVHDLAVEGAVGEVHCQATLPNYYPSL